MAVMHLTVDNFKEVVTTSDKPVLVDFWAPWCGPCKTLGPLIDELSTELEGTTVVAKLNIDDHKKLAIGYKVMSIPTLVLFKNGEEKSRLVGVHTKEEILELLEK